MEAGGPEERPAGTRIPEPHVPFFVALLSLVATCVLAGSAPCDGGIAWPIAALCLFASTVLSAVAVGSLWGLRRASRIRWRGIVYGVLAGLVVGGAWFGVSLFLVFVIAFSHCPIE